MKKLKGKRVFAFCGIGNPEAFLETIKGLGATVAGSKIYDDHYHYIDKDISDIYGEARGVKAELILTTQKDFSKLPEEKRHAGGGIPLGYVAIELKMVSGEDAITRLIKEALAGTIMG